MRRMRWEDYKKDTIRIRVVDKRHINVTIMAVNNKQASISYTNFIFCRTIKNL